MGRDVMIRVSFTSDAGFLTRLAKAIEMDPKIPLPKKKALVLLLNELVSLLLTNGATGDLLASKILEKFDADSITINETSRLAPKKSKSAGPRSHRAKKAG